VYPSIFVPPAGSFTWFDLAALVLLVLLTWNGFRRGLLAWLAGIGATLLSLGLSFVLAPLVPALLPHEKGLSGIVEERIAFVILLIALRLLLGFVLRLLPPLNLLDHLLGIVPGVVMWAVLILVFLAAALLLPIDGRVRQAAADSYIHHVVEVEAGAVLQRLPHPEFLVDPSGTLSAGRQGLPHGGKDGGALH
jgi:hypothetical protein